MRHPPSYLLDDWEWDIWDHPNFDRAAWEKAGCPTDNMEAFIVKRYRRLTGRAEMERRMQLIFADQRFNVELWEEAGCPAEIGFRIRQFIQLPPGEMPLGWEDENVMDEEFWPKKRRGLPVLWTRRVKPTVISKGFF